MFVPPWLDPTEPNIDAILMQEMNMIGTAMAADLTAAGKTGVSIHAVLRFLDARAALPGVSRRPADSDRIGQRAAGHADHDDSSEQICDENALGYNPRERSWNYLEPWPGGTWRLRDIIDYQLIALESCLYNAALHREELLRNFYRVGQRQIARTDPGAS